ncbi:MAG: hypothetical protein ACE362_26070 [Phaeodactylibacter xiamenensis]|uniref:Uncharacterized protein n=1 Tax=Phaeodactylibacter xiamenensis TaxID=1524460 RepID=A0A098S8R8_9BACT|nr:hypothetical protein [Phaeodactylibacter xiamenensis]KGE87477.1 hypothetical protein IX84_14780 [Phaeodactylibacter xiamenensis]
MYWVFWHFPVVFCQNLLGWPVSELDIINVGFSQKEFCFVNLFQGALSHFYNLVVPVLALQKMH